MTVKTEIRRPVQIIGPECGNIVEVHGAAIKPTQQFKLNATTNTLRLVAMDAAYEALFNMKTAEAYHWKDFVRDRRSADSARCASPTGEDDPTRMLARVKKTYYQLSDKS